MRIVGWNVNHRILEKAIPDQMTEAIVSLGPDVVVLTEYVHGASREAFLGRLADHGFCHWFVSDRRPRENQVLIAASSLLEPGPIRAPEIAPSVPSNALHVRLPDHGLEILGIRVPDYSKVPKTKRACWDWILETARSVSNRPFVMIGDFNTDANYPRSRCGDRIKKLIDDGWQHAAPPEGSSYWNLNGHPVRIDHAFVSRHFTVTNAAYVTNLGGYIYAGRDPGALSDHAALAIDITRSEPYSTSASLSSQTRES
jgi:endonuclease/exonuclease/phosphatase family metal-dependent hydrolase